MQRVCNSDSAPTAAAQAVSVASGREHSQSGRVTPVTFLSGFLGAGKTTLVNHLLKNSRGRRIAVVVNDLGEVNIDGALIRENANDALMEITDGCFCCNIQEDLVHGLLELAGREPGYDHIVVEASGAGDPEGLVRTVDRAAKFMPQLAQAIRIQSLVTVINSPLLLQEWQRMRGARESRDAGLSASLEPVFELMVQQIECADLLLANKDDCLSESEREEIRTIVRAMNERAELKFIREGQADLEELLDQQRFELKATVCGARWMTDLRATKKEAKPSISIPLDGVVSSRHQPGAAFNRHGLSSFVYRARLPFRAAAFKELFAQSLPGVIRAKGFCWLDDCPRDVSLLSISGNIMRRNILGRWWIDRIAEGDCERSDVPDLIAADWEEPHGDRRQELVFIGTELNEEKLRKNLDGCLADHYWGD